MSFGRKKYVPKETDVCEAHVGGSRFLVTVLELLPGGDVSVRDETGETMNVRAARLTPSRPRATLTHVPSTHDTSPAPTSPRPAPARRPNEERSEPLPRETGYRHPQGRVGIPKDPPARVPAFMAYVRTLPCSWCVKPPPSDPHHFGPHAMGMKTDDLRCIPLCREHHDEYGKRRAIGSMNVEQTREWSMEKVIETLIGWVMR